MSKTNREVAYVPITPAGTALTWLAASTRGIAWSNLLKDASHMPYKDVEGFQARGYRVEAWNRADVPTGTQP